MSGGSEYRVFIRGENYMTASGRLGFYTTRFVVASSREEAMERAVQMIRDEIDERFPSLLNDPNDSPQIVIEELTDGWEGYEGGQPGFAFFGDPEVFGVDEPT